MLPPASRRARGEIVAADGESAGRGGWNDETPQLRLANRGAEAHRCKLRDHRPRAYLEHDVRLKAGVGTSDVERPPYAGAPGKTYQRMVAQALERDRPARTERIVRADRRDQLPFGDDSESPSVNGIETPGWSLWNPASSCGTSGTAHPLTIPTVSCPRTKPESSSTANRASAAASRAARANGRIAAPTSVSLTEAPGTIKQRVAQFPLELTDLCADAGLADVDALGGAFLDHREADGKEDSMSDQDKALKPEDLTRMFVERANRGDAAGVAALYEEEAVMAYPPGQLTVGRDAIRGLWEVALRSMSSFEPEPPLPTLISGDIALTSTVAKDGTGARAQVARRQADGSWLRLLDQPELLSTGERPPVANFGELGPGGGPKSPKFAAFERWDG